MEGCNLATVESLNFLFGEWTGCDLHKSAYFLLP
jgi:hypothetical protein